MKNGSTTIPSARYRHFEGTQKRDFTGVLVFASCYLLYQKHFLAAQSFIKLNMSECLPYLILIAFCPSTFGQPLYNVGSNLGTPSANRASTTFITGSMFACQDWADASQPSSGRLLLTGNVPTLASQHSATESWPLQSSSATEPFAAISALFQQWWLTER